MKTEEESISQIEQFLKGELDNRTTATLRNRMLVDRAFAEEVRSMKNVLDLIAWAQVSDSGSSYSRLQKKRMLRKQSTAKRLRKKRLIWMMALILILIFTGYALAVMLRP